VFSDFRHVNKREVEGFRCDLKRVFKENPEFWTDISSELSERLQDTSEMRKMKFKHDTLRVQCIIPKHAKDIIDKIDKQLAKHYALTAQELDFVINYDFKYRVGVDEDETEQTTVTAN
jgi:prephenate dehydrogenase